MNNLVQRWYNDNRSSSTTANELSSSQMTMGDPSTATNGNNPSPPPTMTL